MLIASDSELEKFAKRARCSALLAIDTEFLRESTYYPKLCLLQIATDDEIALIDPFGLGSIEPLVPLLEDEAIAKVFHAGTQDIEIIYHETDCTIRNIFDTQVAAAVLGHSLQTGYGSLVMSLCGVQLKKGDSFTDWSRRPLSSSQLDYAADDVRYLPQMYEKLRSELEELDRYKWVEGEFASLSERDNYRVDPRNRYKKLKHVNQLSGRQLAAAREVAQWRELLAEKRNIPRKWVLSDEQVIEACRKEPETIDQLLTIRGMPQKLNTKTAREVLSAIRTGLSLPKKDWPKQESSSRNERSVDAEVDALNAILKLRAKQHGIAPQVLAGNAELAAIARGYTDLDVLQGWRREIVGEDLIAFSRGELALSIGDDKLKVTKCQ